MSIIQVDDPSEIRGSIGKRIEEIATAAKGRQKETVYVLGRYNTDKQYVPTSYDESRVTVEFLTVHSAKGLEADHVILPKMTNETLGFPCRVGDDPLLQLSMPDGDSFENAEERRLFYVALTRAKCSVTLMTVAGKESCFIVELVENNKLPVTSLRGESTRDEICPVCRLGSLIKRTSAYGPFYGCSRYPKCKHKFDLGAKSKRPSNRSSIRTSATATSKRPPT